MTKPVEWYLKEADTLIAAYMDSVFSTLKITHAHWLILKTIADAGEITLTTLYPKMKWFISAPALKQTTSDLEKREWLKSNGKTCRLTLTGKSVFDLVEHLQEENRKKMTVGINKEDYLTAVNVLIKLISNLHAALQSDIPR